MTHLFSTAKIANIELKNRIIMPPLYLGYAGEGGYVSELLLEHYTLMAKSGVAMVVVESSSVDHPAAGGGARTIRADTDEYLEGLTKLAARIKKQGAVACIQLNHAGRFSPLPGSLAPSNIDTFGMGRTFKEMDANDFKHVANKFADAALRAKRAGFDMVELHGGTGYLLSQFISPWTNQRQDEYGGSLENMQRFPLEVLEAVKNAVGDFPVGYRFLAEEWLPKGLKLDESIPFARALANSGVAYLSVMGGTWESFLLPEVLTKSTKQCYMTDLAAAVKKQVDVPVIAAGRIATGKVAESVLADGSADLIGIARPLWADPQWPEKVKQGRDDEIIPCDPACGDVCMQRVMSFKPAFCKQWPAEKKAAFKKKFV